MNTESNLWHTNHVLTVARQMLTQFTLMVTSFAFRATRTPRRTGTHTYTQMKMNEYNSSDQLNSCTNEESVNQQMRSIGSTDTEIPYASHIIMTMGKLLDSKLNQKKRLSLRRWKNRSALWTASFPHLRKANRNYRRRTRCRQLLRGYVRLADGQPTSWCGKCQERLAKSNPILTGIPRDRPLLRQRRSRAYGH